MANQLITIRNTTSLPIGLTKIVFGTPNPIQHVANLSGLSGGREFFTGVEYVAPTGNLTQVPANGSISFNLDYVYFGGGSSTQTATVAVYGTGNFSSLITSTIVVGSGVAPTPAPIAPAPSPEPVQVLPLSLSLGNVTNITSTGFTLSVNISGTIPAGSVTLIQWTTNRLTGPWLESPTPPTVPGVFSHTFTGAPAATQITWRGFVYTPPDTTHAQTPEATFTTLTSVPTPTPAPVPAPADVRVIQSSINTTEAGQSVSSGLQGVTPGNTIFAFTGGYFDGGTGVNLTSSVNGSWTAHNGAFHTGGTSVSIGVFSHSIVVPTGVTEITVTATPAKTPAATNAYISLTLVEVADATSIQALATAIGRSATPTVNLSSIVSPALILAATSQSGVGAPEIAAGAGFTMLRTKNANAGLGVASKKVTANGENDPSFTLTSTVSGILSENIEWPALALAINQVGSSAPVAPPPSPTPTPVVPPPTPTPVPPTPVAPTAYPSASDSRRFVWVDPVDTWAASRVPVAALTNGRPPFVQVNKTWRAPTYTIGDIPEPGITTTVQGEYTLQRVTHPDNPAKMAHFHRIDSRYDTWDDGTMRSQYWAPGGILDDNIYWAAFSFRLGADMASATPTAPGEGLNIFDIHHGGTTSSTRNRQPIELFWAGGNNFRLDHFGQYNTGQAQIRTTSWTSNIITAGTPTWHHFILRFRVSKSASGNPFATLWYGTGSGGITQVANQTGVPMGFYDMATDACYPKIGLYRWQTDVRRTVWTTGMYVFRDGAGTPTLDQNSLYSLLLDRQ